MAIPATQMRPGMIIKYKDQLHLVFSVEHRTPGNLRAFIQAKLKNIRTGAMFVERFRSPDPIESSSTRSRWSTSTPMARTTTSWMKASSRPC